MWKPALICLIVIVGWFILSFMANQSCYDSKSIPDSTDRLIYEKLCEINSNLEVLVSQPKGDKICVPPPLNYRWQYDNTNNIFYAETEYCNGTRPK